MYEDCANDGDSGDQQWSENRDSMNLHRILR